jgi:hypothetical protein
LITEARIHAHAHTHTHNILILTASKSLINSVRSRKMLYSNTHDKTMYVLV